MVTLHVAAAVVLGLIVGSFVNVVIWRLPRRESLLWPGSHCLRCGSSIAWFDNVPVLSWLLLRARCRTCGGSISWRYPLVEAATGSLFGLTWLVWGHHMATAAIVALVLAALLALSVIDWELKILPDRLTKPGLVLGILSAPITLLPAHPRGWLPGARPGLEGMLVAVAGALVGALLIQAVRLVGSAILRKEAMGFGDVKLMAFLGAFLGPLDVLYALVLGSVSGAVGGSLLLLVGARRPLPCAGTIRLPGGAELAFAQVGVRGATLDLPPLEGLPADGTGVEVSLVLPASRVLEEADVHLRLKGRVQAARSGAPRSLVLDGLGESETELLARYARSWRYIPFGPFLSLGGAAMLLAGPALHRFVTEVYPAWIRGLLGR